MIFEFLTINGADADYEDGDIVCIFPQGHPWGRKERGGRFRIHVRDVPLIGLDALRDQYADVEVTEAGQVLRNARGRFDRATGDLVDKVSGTRRSTKGR